MRELDRLRRGLEATLDGDPWYGLAVAAILDGVSAEGAAARPIPEAHSIWELVLHMTSWVNEANRRLRGGGHAEPEGRDRQKAWFLDNPPARGRCRPSGLGS